MNESVIHLGTRFIKNALQGRYNRTDQGFMGGAYA